MVGGTSVGAECDVDVPGIEVSDLGGDVCWSVDRK